MLTADRIGILFSTVREHRPLIHNITNYVAMNITANTLLAIGASPAMVHTSEEVEDFVTAAQALAVNIGTLSPERTAAIKLAIARANHARIPWVFDPVGAGATPYRTHTAWTLSERRPTVIRGNGTEILALACQDEILAPAGVDSIHSSNTAIDAGMMLARRTGSVVAVTGETDHITDGDRTLVLANGHPLMARVTGLGCSLTAVIAAFLAVETDPFAATAAATAIFGVAGEIAGETAPGPGTLQIALLDTLYSLDTDTLQSRLHLQ